MEPCNLGSPRNPFVVALLDAVASGRDSFHDNPLSSYYRRVQPATAAHVIGLGDGSGLAKFPPWGTVLPWQRLTPAEQRDRCLALEETESCTHGPVSDRKGAEEIARLLSAYRSIERHGFTRELGEVTGSLLLAEDDWACHIVDGLHRVAAMQALGHVHVPVRIVTRGELAPVRRSDVDAWPHVRSGLFSRTEALDVFDRIVRGNESGEADQSPAVAACKAPA
jgi:hypothetical protein